MYFLGFMSVIFFPSGRGKTKPASAGHLELLFYDLSQQPLECQTAIFYEKGGANNTLELAGMKLDVKDNGTITVSKLNWC